MKVILLDSICHWSSAMNFDEKDYTKKIKKIELLYMRRIKI